MGRDFCNGGWNAGIDDDRSMGDAESSSSCCSLAGCAHCVGCKDKPSGGRGRRVPPSVLPDDEVHLRTIDVPHVTLYLTSFLAKDVGTVVAKAGEVVAGFGSCASYLNATVVSGAYGLWTGPPVPCLQAMSDALVRALVPYIGPVSVPAWVNNLPPKEREEKIKLIHEYGSPNVFQGFQPHVTLAWDNSTSPTTFGSASDALGLNGVVTDYHPSAIAISHTGPHGTVLRNGTIAQFPL